MKITLEETENLAFAALLRAGAHPAQARPVARSIRAAEAEGTRGIGLGYLPWYCGHLKVGKIAGDAEPEVILRAPSVIYVDARDGFAHPAYEAGEDALIAAARDHGIALMGVSNAYACGVLGYFVDRLARAGLVALATTNSSAAIAPWGGAVPFFGTNPWAFAAPRDGDPLVMDGSSSATAYVNVANAAKRGEPIPPDWALDAAGKPTTDAALGLSGSMAPAGGHKGAAMALMVEILAAGLTGAHWSFQASSLADDEGGPPRLGQCLIAISPGVLSGGDFSTGLEVMLSAMQSQPGVRLPGARRHANRKLAEQQGVEISREFAAELTELAGRPPRPSSDA
ncbi:MAG: Ldh family oxidoreductase [Paracoccaceae bacterium]|nr:Ldh family oxidoreductase [Paracoccaceae bacterium]